MNEDTLQWQDKDLFDIFLKFLTSRNEKKKEILNFKFHSKVLVKF